MRKNIIISQKCPLFTIKLWKAFFLSSISLQLWCPSGVYGRLRSTIMEKGNRALENKCLVSKIVIFHVHCAKKESSNHLLICPVVEHHCHGAHWKITIIPPWGGQLTFSLSAITPCGSVQLLSFTGWFCLAVPWVDFWIQQKSTEIPSLWRHHVAELLRCQPKQGGWETTFENQQWNISFHGICLKVWSQFLKVNSSITILAHENGAYNHRLD